jgi:hypothetical protein
VVSQVSKSGNSSLLVYYGGAVVGKVLAWAKRNSIPIADVAINVNFLKKWQSVAFQAADLLAYESFRANQKIVPTPGIYELGDLRNPLQGLIEIPNYWGVTGKPKLEAFCIEQNIPLRNPIIP